MDAPTTRPARQPLVLEGAAHHVSLDTGDRHACVIRSDGNVYCWGANDAQQTDPSDTSGAPVTSLFAANPIALPGGAKAVEVAVGDRFSCARLQNGSVVCWGSNTDFIHPTGTYGIIPPTVIPITVSADGSATRTARAITAGQRHVCVLRDDGSVVCLGSNVNNKLGRLAGFAADVVRTNGSSPLGTLPTGTTDALDKVVEISAAGSHTCALQANGQVQCWGRWDGNSVSLAMPVFGSNPGILHIAAGGDLGVDGSGGEVASRDHTCALSVNHHLWCWGTNADGQLGDGTTTRATAPVEVKVSSTVAFDDVVAFAGGDRHTCATTLDDRTFCWGANGDGQLSRTSTAPTIYTPSSSEPVGASSPLPGVHTIAAGKAFTCVTALNSSTFNDGAVKCWGRNDVGQLGNNSTTSSLNPVTTFTPDTACQLGYEPYAYYYYVWTSPHQGPLLDAGHEHTCAFVERSSCTGTSGTYTRGVLCWGRNDFQQVGINVGSSQLGPSFVPLDANITQISAGGHHTCAVDTLGRVWCWGSNGNRECIDSSATTVNTPTVVNLGSLPPAIQVTAGADFTCALLSDGTVACWGSNRFGTLGRENPEPSWTYLSVAPPLVVPLGLGQFSGTPARVRCGLASCSGCTNLEGVKQVSAGSHSVCALLADGTLRCWGQNPRSGQTANTAIFGTCNDLRFCGATGTTPYNEGNSHLNPVVVDVLPFAGSVNLNFDPASPFESVSVSTHDKGACLLRVGGVAQCWGEGDSGRRGDGATSGITHLNNNVTLSGAPFGHVIGINGGWATKCAVRNDGAVYCWGLNATHQAGVEHTGLPNTLAIANPNQIHVSPTAFFGGGIAVTAGQSHACAMNAGNQISCWGDNTNTQLGRAGSASHLAQAIYLP